MALDGEQHPRALALRQAREAAIARLSEGFARDELSLDELERRVDRAYAADDATELDSLVADLAPATSALAPSPGPLAAPARADATPPARLALAVFGNVERRVSGVWRGARVSAVFGNVELDLRDVTLPPGVTEIEVLAICGNVELTLPPTLAVECAGAPLLGSFASLHRVPRAGEGEPLLRIVGRALLGNVEVKTVPSRALLDVGRRARLGPGRDGSR